MIPPFSSLDQDSGLELSANVMQGNQTKPLSFNCQFVSSTLINFIQSHSHIYLRQFFFPSQSKAGPRRQPGPQPNHQTGGVHQLGAVDVTVEGEPVAPAATVAPPASADQNVQFLGDDTGVGDDVVVQGDVHLNSDPNQLDPVWRLRYSAGITIYGATITALTLPRNLRAVHTTYEASLVLSLINYCSLTDVPS